MIPDETVGNPHLESECLAAKLISGLLLPDAYTNLRVNMAGISMIPSSDKLMKLTMELQDEVVSKQGPLDDKVLKKYYYGENPELKSLLKRINKQVDKDLVAYETALVEKLESATNEIADASDTMDYFDMAQVVDKSQVINTEIQQMDKTHTDLRIMQGLLRATIQAYGEGKDRLPTKAVVTPKLSTEYKLYIQGLLTNLDEVTSNMTLVMTTAKALDSLMSLVPKDDLDPYLEDVCKNFIEAVTKPETFYSMCERDEIVSSSVGQMFAHSYPEYYNKYLDMYMDDIPEMDYQAQIDFRKCFGLDSNDSEITALCSQYVKLGFKQQ